MIFPAGIRSSSRWEEGHYLLHLPRREQHGRNNEVTLFSRSITLWFWDIIPSMARLLSIRNQEGTLCNRFGRWKTKRPVARCTENQWLVFRAMFCVNILMKYTWGGPGNAVRAHSRSELSRYQGTTRCDVQERRQHDQGIFEIQNYLFIFEIKILLYISIGFVPPQNSPIGEKANSEWRWVIMCHLWILSCHTTCPFSSPLGMTQSILIAPRILWMRLVDSAYTLFLSSPLPLPLRFSHYNALMKRGKGGGRTGGGKGTREWG